jgi:hypothetical protein
MGRNEWKDPDGVKIAWGEKAAQHTKVIKRSRWVYARVVHDITKGVELAAYAAAATKGAATGVGSAGTTSSVRGAAASAGAASELAGFSRGATGAGSSIFGGCSSTLAGDETSFALDLKISVTRAEKRRPTLAALFSFSFFSSCVRTDRKYIVSHSINKYTFGASTGAGSGAGSEVGSAAGASAAAVSLWLFSECNFQTTKHARLLHGFSWSLLDGRLSDGRGLLSLGDSGSHFFLSRFLSGRSWSSLAKIWARNYEADIWILTSSFNSSFFFSFLGLLGVFIFPTMLLVLSLMARSLARRPGLLGRSSFLGASYRMLIES